MILDPYLNWFVSSSFWFTFSLINPGFSFLDKGVQEIQKSGKECIRVQELPTWFLNAYCTCNLQLQL